jgi:dTDP-4-dehydrorhamnose reductase
MSDKILIIGKGYVGSRLQEALGCEISDKKIFSFKDAQDEVRKYKPDILINCVGHVGRNVDDCEQDIDKSLMVNSFIPIILAEAALRDKIRYVHISSGCIYHYDYDKDAPIKEERIPDFFELFYSRTKIIPSSPWQIWP